MHSSRIRTAGSLPYRGGGSQSKGRGLFQGDPPPPDRDPLPLWTERQTRVKTLPCPKLRLRAVTIFETQLYKRAISIVHCQRLFKDVLIMLIVLS